MSRQVWKGSTLLNPEPPVLVSCGAPEKPNLITVGWTGTICTQPPMLSISVRPERYSHHLIKESGEFVVNLPTESLVRAIDWCGVKSGRDVDKFALCGLTPREVEGFPAPALDEAPAFLCCRVDRVIPLGSHDLFLARIEQVYVRDDLFDADGSLHMARANLVAYAHGEYFPLAARPEGFFGYSVAREDVLRRRLIEPYRQGKPSGKTPAAGKRPGGRKGGARR